MNWTENVALKEYNSFGINAVARYFARFTDVESLAALLQSWSSRQPSRPPSPRHPFILGGGSNILLTHNIDAPVLKNEIPGIELILEDEKYLYVRVGAGESWHRFTQHCLARNWAGVENLSLIPGSVGAAPMQNIGAYGVELKSVFHELEAWDLEDGKVRMFTLNDCHFGYRESVFKKEYKGRFIILNVTFRLNRIPTFHTEYGAIREELDKMSVHQLTIQAVAQAVIHIRSTKLPDPAQIGNAGSFFKNPTIPDTQFATLQKQFPGIIGYPNSGPETTATSPRSKTASTNPGPPASTKLAAGWLIEQCGWKGYRRGDAGCHASQALVLVNYGHATGKEIYDLSEEILRSVQQKFGVTLEREVNIL
jgi:UDP-N-acetylmuramate dehydrogenase